MTPLVERKRLSRFSVFILAFLSITSAEVHEVGQEAYPIDSSWAIMSATLADTFGDKQALYDSFLKGCNEALQERDDMHGSNCDDKSRIKMNSEQPVGMRVSCTRKLTHWLSRLPAASHRSSYLILQYYVFSLLELHEIGIYKNQNTRTCLESVARFLGTKQGQA
jgi:hypothetical protein